jgi:hypothetical protein
MGSPPYATTDARKQGEVAGDKSPFDDDNRRLKSGSLLLTLWRWRGLGERTETGRDTNLDALIRESSRGIDPGGFRERHRVYAVARPAHNPYFTLVGGIVLVPCSIYVLVQMQNALVFAILALVFVDGIYLVLLAFTIRRIPVWHRARRIARAYIAEHGGSMPPELKVWN